MLRGLVIVCILISCVYGDRLLCLSILPCANPIRGDFRPFNQIVTELAHRGHQIEFVLFDDYVSWPEDHPNIRKRSAGHCPYTNLEEENFFKEFSHKAYDDTIFPIVSYFQTYSIALTDSIWNEKESIEQSLGGPIDALLFGDVFMLGAALAERFDIPFITIHPAHIFEGGLNSISGSNIHAAQTDTQFFDSRSIPVPKVLQSTINFVFSYFIDYQIAKDTINFENEYRRKQGFHLLPEGNNYLYSSSVYSGKHDNLYPIASILCNSPGFSPTVEMPPFVHYAGPIIRQSIPLEKIDSIRDVLAWMESDDRDIIVLSLSTVAHFSVRSTNAILNALSSLKEQFKVLWVIREAARQSLPSDFVKPENFMLVTFLPQYDVLGHPKVKVFFGVGGINSLFESIVQEKPILCCGSHWEQNYNCKRIESLGLGFSLDKNELTPEVIKEKFSVILQNSAVYLKSLKEVKKLFLSNNGTIVAADIVEQALRIGSNKFLLPRTVHMNYYQRASAVEISIIVVALIIVIRLIIWIIIRFLRMIFSVFHTKSKKD